MSRGRSSPMGVRKRCLSMCLRVWGQFQLTSGPFGGNGAQSGYFQQTAAMEAGLCAARYWSELFYHCPNAWAPHFGNSMGYLISGTRRIM